MNGWPLSIALDRGDPRPLYRQLADAVRGGIARGRLSSGAPLPGTRALAEHLGVHRNTVLRAYADLTADGWLTSAPSAGTFVSPELPATAALAGSRGPADAVGYDLPPAPPVDDRRPRHPRQLPLTSLPDVRDVPAAAWARAWRRVLRLHGRRALAYADPRGDRGLRAALAEMLARTRGLAVGPDDVLITRGSQMGLYLAGLLFRRPGVVAVEALGYRPGWHSLAAGGAELVPVPVDGQGLDISALAELCRTTPVRAVYTTPHHQYPTTVSLTPARRLRLLALAAEHRFAIIEDDYDNEFRYEGEPLMPMASVDDRGSVIYLGTLSKVLAPGLRLGFVVAPRPVLERMVAHRLHIDRQGDTLGEMALAELFADGEVQRHVQRMRRAYRRRRDRAIALLRQHLGHALEFDAPPGGMAVWTRVAPGVDVDAWQSAALAADVFTLPGSAFTFDGAPLRCFRLGYAGLTLDELEVAIERLARACPTAARKAL